MAAWRALGADRPLYLAILGVGWFAAYAVVLLGLLRGDGGTASDLTTLIAAGVAMGALADWHLSQGHNELGLVPFGSLGMTVLAFGLAALPESATSSRTGLALANGAFLAWFVRPLLIFIRDRRTPVGARLRVAATLVSLAVFVVVGAGLLAGFRAAGLAPWHGLIALGCMNAAVALFIYRLLPEFLLRFIAWLLVHALYRLERDGMHHVPSEGAALITCNHVSFADAVVVMAACPRPIRFVMDHRIFRSPLLSFVFRESRAIPIAPAKEDPRMLEAAFETVADALAAGELVGIFPEGAITRDGELQTFRPGMARILQRSPVQVVPMGLSGLWGSVFSRCHRGLMRFVPKGIAPCIRLRVGTPVAPADADPAALQAITLELRGTVR
jgi:1-acyl-sn-glycerol-3-phosphate acyltransferase